MYVYDEEARQYSLRVAGVAWPGRTCNWPDTAHAVTEDFGRYLTTSYAAHEPGHKYVMPTI